MREWLLAGAVAIVDGDDEEDNVVRAGQIQPDQRARRAQRAQANPRCGAGGPCWIT
ncbi:hypothetical protein [Nocardia fluminea]|uniref:hypothetical protein n=1 Tax=Nocardia fluminea TaxID=134984 RepID=UPI0033F0D404